MNYKYISFWFILHFFFTELVTIHSGIALSWKDTFNSAIQLGEGKTASFCLFFGKAFVLSVPVMPKITPSMIFKESLSVIDFTLNVYKASEHLEEGYLR